MQITLSSLLVEDQDRALSFHTSMLGFEVKHDIPMGTFRKLKARGVVLRGEPQAMGPIHTVLFEDTCGNLVNLVQPTA